MSNLLTFNVLQLINVKHWTAQVRSRNVLHFRFLKLNFRQNYLILKFGKTRWAAISRCGEDRSILEYRDRLDEKEKNHPFNNILN